jgi:hypothetical protein
VHPLLKGGPLDGRLLAGLCMDRGSSSAHARVQPSKEGRGVPGCTWGSSRAAHSGWSGRFWCRTARLPPMF